MCWWRQLYRTEESAPRATLMTSSHDALYRAICAHPDEDTPRLVFADLIEENGEYLRARFIRTQIALARLPEYDPAWVTRSTARTGRRNRLVHRCTCCRSCPAGTAGTGSSSVAGSRGRSACGRGPNSSKRVRQSSRSRPFKRSTSVALTGPIIKRVALDWPHLIRLRKLEVSVGLNDETDITRLAESEYATNLTELGFEFDGLTTDGLRTLAASPLFPRLTDLELRSISIPSAAARRFALAAARAGPEFALFARLSLPNNHLDRDDAEHLFALPVMHNLEYLDVSDNKLNVEGTIACSR